MISLAKLVIVIILSALSLARTEVNVADQIVADANIKMRELKEIVMITETNTTMKETSMAMTKTNMTVKETSMMEQNETMTKENVAIMKKIYQTYIWRSSNVSSQNKYVVMAYCVEPGERIPLMPAWSFADLAIDLAAYVRSWWINRETCNLAFFVNGCDYVGNNRYVSIEEAEEEVYRAFKGYWNRLSRDEIIDYYKNRAKFWNTS